MSIAKIVSTDKKKISQVKESKDKQNPKSQLLDVIYQQEIQLEQLNIQLANKDHKLAQQSEQLQQQLQQLQQLSNKLEQVRIEKQAIMNSTSWKITLPIRKLKNLSLAIRHILLTLYKKPSLLNKWLKKYTYLLISKVFKSTSEELQVQENDKQEQSILDESSNFINRTDSYQYWYQKYYAMTASKQEKMLEEINRWHNPPLISIIMPVHNTEKNHLIEAIDSVQAQIYENWQLCIADDASTATHIQPLLKSYAQKDHRIEVIFREKNGHISLASNSAIAIARGEYIAFLDHDDLLTEDALFWVAKTIMERPETQLIYSDEDRLGIDGLFDVPYFKPDWNPELFLSHNYLTHFSVYSKAVITESGGLRAGYEGAQDYDLALRVTEQLKPTQIQHIARILYHWRMIPQSTASGLEAKPYAFNAGLKALNDYLQRNQIDAQAVDAPDVHGNYRIKYQLPTPPPLISLVIPTYNQYRILRQCIDSILEKTDYLNYEIIIVDNNSDDIVTLEYLSILALQDNIKVIRYPYEFNFSAINNFAVKQASGSLIGLLNNDLEVINRSWLTEMVSHALQPGVGAVGAKLLYPDNTLQHAGIILGIAGSAGHAFKGYPHDFVGHVNRAALIQNFSGVTAACMIMKKQIFEQVGGFDDEHLKIAFNDVDLNCKITQAGYRIVWTPYAKLYHHESISRGYEDTPEKQARMMSEIGIIKTRWSHLLNNDPNYNPNLSLDSEDFALARPPRIAYAEQSTGESIDL